MQIWKRRNDGVSVALNLDYYATRAGRGSGLRRITHQTIVLAIVLAGVRSIHSRGPNIEVVRTLEAADGLGSANKDNLHHLEYGGTNPCATN